MTNPAIDFRVLFEASPDVLVVLLPDAPRYTMVAATEARLDATMATREQTLGRGIFELFPDNPDDPSADGLANLRASLGRVVDTKRADTMAVQKYDIRRPDGTFEEKYWSPTNLPVLSAEGELLYILHRVEDVTELVRANEEGEVLRDRSQAMEREVIRRSRELSTALSDLREANGKLGALDRAKTAFFCNVSHEFRTPLTLMLGPLEEALADIGSHDPAQRARLKLAHDNALRLLKLVNALLDFARLEAGRLRASFAPSDIAAITRELASMFESAVASSGLELVIDCPPSSEPAWLDRDLWEKVVVNLVSNALKFTLNGRIEVRLREEPKSFVLEVIDTGVGIPEAELVSVFERFHRVAGTVGRTHEGTGIGLSLVRELSELHGASVSVTSQLGQGSTFRVELPKGHSHLPEDALRAGPETRSATRDLTAHVIETTRWIRAERASPPPKREADATGPRPRVLLVDDNADLREYTCGLLTPFFDVELAVDGQAGLEAARARLPDIVLSDVMMPRLDGFGLVQALRADPSTAQLPIILLSARAGEESTIDGLSSGADDYLVKPFSAAELLARAHTHVKLAAMRRAFIAELERTNRELDAFSYSVSHDLGAPLRAIDGFSRALVEDCADQVGPTGVDLLERICGAVSRMTALIDGLLDLSRISREPLRRSSVDLSLLAESVTADLRRSDPERRVQIVIESGLLVQGDPRLLSAVITNLLENAWKFTRNTEEPRIELGRVAGAREPTFFVRDNGAGFDMSHASQLFAPFRRLHRRDEFAGTGVGLATVQRIIARHAGAIWAEASVGKGATFSFSLPDNTPAP